MPDEPYYRRELAQVHHAGFGFHADLCAPGILTCLEPVRETGGLVLEIGCGSGLLTRHLLEAGHRVLASDASPAMLDLARDHAPGAEAYLRLALPDDPLPEADAVVSIGHVVSYLDDAGQLERALRAEARALRPGGVFAVDVCDLEWGTARTGAPPYVKVEDDWALVTFYSMPAPDAFIRSMSAFVRQPDDTWRRDDEVHHNVLVDTTRLPAVLAGEGVEVDLGTSFGDEALPVGLRTLVGRRPPGT